MEVKDLGIIINDEDEENSNIQQYTHAVIKTFIIYNSDYLEGLHDVLTAINVKYKETNVGNVG